VSVDDRSELQAPGPDVELQQSPVEVVPKTNARDGRGAASAAVRALARGLSIEDMDVFDELCDPVCTPPARDVAMFVPLTIVTAQHRC